MGSLDLNEFYFWKRIRKWHVILIIVLIVVIIGGQANSHKN